MGDIFGLGSSVFVLFVGGIARVFGSPDVPTIASASLVAIFLFILRIIGGVIASRHVKISGILMSVNGISGFIAILIGFIVAESLLIIGGILALVKKFERRQS